MCKQDRIQIHMFSQNRNYQVLSAKVTIPCVNDNEMWFVAVVALYHFDKLEFSFGTRLKFRAIDITITKLENEPLEGNNIVSMLFAYVKRIKVLLDVSHLLEKQIRRLDVEDIEKLLLVLVVYHFLLGNLMTQAISNFFWHLVDDQDRFKSLPWGLYVYTETIKYFKSKLGGIFFNNSSQSTHLYGLK